MQMKNSIKLSILLIFLSSYISYSADSYIVKFKKTDRLLQIQKQNNITFKAILPETKQLINTYKLQQFQNQVVELSKYYVIENSNAISKLAGDPDIEFIEPNHIYHIEQVSLPNDSLFPEQWALKTIYATEAWQKATGRGIIIGMVDTGIDFEHPDLIHQTAINSKEDANHNGTFEPWNVNETRNGITGDLNGIDEDSNGYIDDVIGYDFVDESTAYFGDWANPDPIPTDEHGHGTSVAGVLSAEGNNKIGIIGLAYNSKILTARAFNAGGEGEADDIAQSIIYLALNGAKIINCSFGDYFRSQLENDAVLFAQSLGCIIVASSGNEGRSDPHFPSDQEGVISVGGCIEGGKIWSGSSYGVNLSLIAPAVNIATCDRNGNYRNISGTSFSAPYVSAAIALILETDSTLKSNEIKSLLITTAHKLNQDGWDARGANGILDVFNALSYIGKGNLEINYPKQFETFDKTKTSKIPIIANIMTPLFQSYQLQIAKSKNYTFTDYPISGNQAVINDTLGLLDIGQLQDSIYTISLKINLQNGQFLRLNKSIQIISSNSRNRINTLKTVSAYKNGKKIQIIAATTDFPSKFWIEVQKADNPDLHYRVDQVINNSTEHYLELNDLFASGDYIGTAYSSIGNSDTANAIFNFNFVAASFSEYNYITKPYSLKRGYLFNSVNDFYQSDIPTVIINDLSDFDIGKTEIYNFKENHFILKDSSLDGWIPVKIGKSPIDNAPALLSIMYGHSILTTSPNNGGNPYSKAIFQSNVGQTLWGDNLFDIDNDGKDEMIAYNDTNFVIYRFTNGTYQYEKSIPKPKLSEKFTISMSSVVGDFDKDGKIEIFIPDIYGRFAIYQYNNQDFQLEYLDSSIYINQEPNPRITSIDLDGDGTPSIIIGTINTNQLFGEKANSTEPIWTFRLIKANDINTYTTAWEENFTGVRSGFHKEIGISFRNGTTVGNLDNDTGDELCISTFPNFMVMKWNKNSSEFTPIWIYKYAFSNSAIIYDFDKNGIADIGIATVDSTRFFELEDYLSKPSKPIISDASSIDENTIRIKFEKVPNAQIYKIYQVEIQPDGSSFITLKATTNLDSIIISNLSAGTYYYFLMTAIDSSKKIIESDFSELLEIFTHNRFKPVDVEALSNRSLIVKFNGKLRNYHVDNAICKIINKDTEMSIIPNSLQLASDTSLILTLDNPLASGNYQLNIASFRDYYGSHTIPDSLDFEIIEQPKPDELYLTSLKVLSPTLILIYFNDYVERTSAETIANYSLNPFGNIIVASRNDPDSNAVMLRLSEVIRERDLTGTEYSITARDINSINSKKMTEGPGNTLSFVLTKGNLNEIYAFPNPVRLSKDESLSFGNLTMQAEITIMNINGKELAKIQETDANGGVRWNLQDKTGNKLGVGIYLYKITGKNSDGVDVLWEMNKFAIVP